ncbi:DUF3796 domain-containing protein [Anaerocolumna aminovalerica]|uniref:DUF3796 domain-containing protein n=1 Tax=Anaerocolumna aminovalerica TaxID=1527 RepID=UPI001C0EDD34|nr:DUF3796 domain-containing protein [Anaerocolumna aminovalerica]MBU5330731.1 DUF3796 domain-containing protein [Anaerocolumna aminovalerica]
MKKIKLNYKSSKYFGFFGFFGFGGFGYFVNHNVSNLFLFCFFSFFSYFIMGKLAKEMPDERFIENSAKARSKALTISLLALFVVGFCSSYSFIPKEVIVLISVIGWVATILAYAFLFCYYEKH